MHVMILTYHRLHVHIEVQLQAAQQPDNLAKCSLLRSCLHATLPCSVSLHSSKPFSVNELYAGILCMLG